jgi:hypothetical protein
MARTLGPWSVGCSSSLKRGERDKGEWLMKVDLRLCWGLQYRKKKIALRAKSMALYSKMNNMICIVFNYNNNSQNFILIVHISKNIAISILKLQNVTPVNEDFSTNKTF